MARQSFPLAGLAGKQLPRKAVDEHRQAVGGTFGARLPTHHTIGNGVQRGADDHLGRSADHVPQKKLSRTQPARDR